MATIIELKAKIKELAKNQSYLKDQSKSKYNKLPRRINYLDAQYEFRKARKNLRAMYFAYGLLRGRSNAEMENIYSVSDSYDKMLISKIQFEYGEEIVRSDR